MLRKSDVCCQIEDKANCDQSPCDSSTQSQMPGNQYGAYVQNAGREAILVLPLQCPQNITTLTFGGHEFTEESARVTLTLWDQYDEPVLIHLWTREVITTVPPVEDLDDPENSPADEKVPVDVLIGIVYYWKIVGLRKNERLPSGLILSQTRFGPVISGLIDLGSSNVTSVVTLLSNTVQDNDHAETDELVRSLFGLDAVGSQDPACASVDVQVIERFYRTVRVINGSIYVKFPWKSDHPPLADNKALAVRRLESEYDKLHAIPSAWTEYCQTFEQQLQSGIIEDVTDIPATGPNIYYITHQAVYKKDIIRTRIWSCVRLTSLFSNPYFGLGRLSNTTPSRYEELSNESYKSITSYHADLRKTSDHFWELWQKEYLAALAEKNATRSPRKQAAKREPRVGDVVLIRQENKARSMWPIGLVLELFTSKDRLPRSALLRAGKKNILERSVNQLVPLEVTASDVNNLERRKTSPAPTRIQPPRAVKKLSALARTQQ
ncbi:hypothetical protein Aduo_002532 [Ancylostoma duodenale]